MSAWGTSATDIEHHALAIAAPGLEASRPEADAAPAASARRISSGSVERALAARLWESFGREVVYRYRLGPDRGFDYISPSCLAMTGYAQDEFYADAGLVDRLIHPEDADELDWAAAGSAPGGQVVRWVRKDGSILWTEHRSAVVSANEVRVAIEGMVRDISETTTAREQLALLERSAQRLVANASAPAVLLDPLGRVVRASQAFLALTGWTAEEVALSRWSSTFLHRDDLRAGVGLLNAVEDGSGETTAPLLLRDGRRRDVRWVTLAIPDARVQRPSILAIGEDLTAAEERFAELAQLRTAVAETSDSVVVTDLDAHVLSVNPAFERATGYRREQAIGHNPRMLQSGHQSAAFYKAMWWILTHGYVWRGELVNRTAEGALLVEEASITPVRDGAGRPVSYVAVKRDVTRLRELRDSIEDIDRQRERLTDAIDRICVGESPDVTAQGIAAMLAELPDVVATAVGLVDDDTSGHYAASQSMGRLGYARGEPLAPAVIARLARHDIDPWVESSGADRLGRAGDAGRDGVDPSGSGGAHRARARVAALRKAGIGAIVHVPVYRGPIPIGVLVLCGSATDGTDILAQMASLNEVSAVMRALLGADASARQARQDDRDRIAAIVRDSRFEIVFQPIVDLLNGRRAGYEALTRFADGTPPALVFGAARACGMDRELELATLRAALAASDGLPRDAWLSLNVSAGLLVREPDLTDLLATAERELVIEIVDDGSQIDGQEARAALQGISVTARLAVDDSGDGAVTPRSLVEMRPDFVKLDISLIRDVDADPRRQQLVRGLKSFAKAAGGVLIAEGIESLAERDTLARLGVPFGQGFLFGRPASASSWGGGRRRALRFLRR